MQKSLRTGSVGDEQFDEFVEPPDAVIQIAISSDVRQVGKVRLLQKIATFLRNEGYSNVTLTDEEYGLPVNSDCSESNSALVELQNQVHIDLKLVSHQ